ncbi:RING finger protein 214 isoform X2 [Xenopus laevis]|uniref:RING finger protein 214 isoform X2 n=1 Tax=Xenopus laevis TaxID=8355 RepID=A0A8J1L6M6_XENLA|nr:RING finger protein 214 isoform X2 [Xenopus laevis]
MHTMDLESDTSVQKKSSIKDGSDQVHSMDSAPVAMCATGEETDLALLGASGTLDTNGMQPEEDIPDILQVYEIQSRDREDIVSMVDSEKTDALRSGLEAGYAEKMEDNEEVISEPENVDPIQNPSTESIDALQMDRENNTVVQRSNRKIVHAVYRLGRKTYRESGTDSGFRTRCIAIQTDDINEDDPDFGIHCQCISVQTDSGNDSETQTDLSQCISVQTDSLNEDEPLFEIDNESPTVQEDYITEDEDHSGTYECISVQTDYENKSEVASGIHTQCISVQTDHGSETEPDFMIQAQAVPVQTDYEMKDAETTTEKNTEQILREVLNQRDQLKDNYQVVLDRQTQTERQLQVQIKQLKQRREEEIQKHQETLKSIQDVTLKREETRKKMDKERKDQSQKEQDLRADLERLQSKSQQLQLEHKELENKIVTLLAEQTKEKEQWDTELNVLKKLDNEMRQSVLEEAKRASQAEVLSLESRRDLFLATLEEAENEAEVTLFRLRAAPRTLDLIKLEQRWDGRLEGIRLMKANLREQFGAQIQQVKNGSKLSSLQSILAPNLPSPPSDTSLLLHKIAVTPLQVSIPSSDVFHPQPQIPPPFAQHSALLSGVPSSFAGAVPLMQRAPSAAQFSGACEAPVPPSTEKISKIMEKLLARFPQCSQSHLTGILQQIKVARGTLSGLTVEALCNHVAERLTDAPDPGSRATLSPASSRPVYRNPPAAPTYLAQSQGTYTGQTPMVSGLRKLCLVCQTFVQPSDLQPMSCSHAMHRECIRCWAPNNQYNCCPFCPSQK